MLSGAASGRVRVGVDVPLYRHEKREILEAFVRGVYSLRAYLPLRINFKQKNKFQISPENFSPEKLQIFFCPNRSFYYKKMHVYVDRYKTGSINVN